MIGLLGVIVFVLITASMMIGLIYFIARGMLATLRERKQFKQLAQQIGCEYLGMQAFNGTLNTGSWRAIAHHDTDENTYTTTFTATLPLPKNSYVAVLSHTLQTETARLAKQPVKELPRSMRWIMTAGLFVAAAVADADIALGFLFPKEPDQDLPRAQRILIGSEHFKQNFCVVLNDTRWIGLITPTLEKLWLDWPGIDTQKMVIKACDHRMEIKLYDQGLNNSADWRHFITLGIHLAKQMESLTQAQGNTQISPHSSHANCELFAN